ncbi:MAG TPA: enoyl-CoA hydratase/isomerase family protein, partial [Caulobacteraceae bacterium]
VAEPAIRVYTALSAAPVPVLGVVRGRAEGYGLGLLASADVVLAGAGAAFSIPEMLRQIPPTLVMTALLGRTPAKLVAHLVLSQEAIGAADALAQGLVSKVVADDALDDEMEALTQRIVSYRGDSVRAIKEYLRFAEGRDRSAAGSFAANLAASALSARFGGET